MHERAWQQWASLRLPCSCHQKLLSDRTEGRLLPFPRWFGPKVGHSPAIGLVTKEETTCRWSISGSNILFQLHIDNVGKEKNVRHIFLLLSNNQTFCYFQTITVPSSPRQGMASVPCPGADNTGNTHYDSIFFPPCCFRSVMSGGSHAQPWAFNIFQGYDNPLQNSKRVTWTSAATWPLMGQTRSHVTTLRAREPLKRWKIGSWNVLLLATGWWPEICSTTILARGTTN